MLLGIDYWKLLKMVLFFPPNNFSGVDKYHVLEKNLLDTLGDATLFWWRSKPITGDSYKIFSNLSWMEILDPVFYSVIEMEPMTILISKQIYTYITDDN